MVARLPGRGFKRTPPIPQLNRLRDRDRNEVGTCDPTTKSGDDESHYGSLTALEKPINLKVAGIGDDLASVLTLPADPGRHEHSFGAHYRGGARILSHYGTYARGQSNSRTGKAWLVIGDR